MPARARQRRAQTRKAGGPAGSISDAPCMFRRRSRSAPAEPRPRAPRFPAASDGELLERLCGWLPTGVVGYAAGSGDQAEQPALLPAPARARLRLLERCLSALLRAGATPEQLQAWLTLAPGSYGAAAPRTPLRQLHLADEPETIAPALEAAAYAYAAWLAQGRPLRAVAWAPSARGDGNDADA